MPVNHQKNIIEIKNLSFAYRENIVLKDVNLTIHQGDYLGVIGPNGSGKSTLLKLIVGLLPKQNGEILLFGEPIDKFKKWHKFGYISQRAINFDFLFPATVTEVVAMGRYNQASLFNRTKQTDKNLIEQALRNVDMWDFRDRLIGDLSSGQQQRIFIARALCSEPEVILLDEPTVGVDISAQEKFYTLLKKLNQELNLTLIMVSHDMEAMAKEATELACVNQNVTYHSDPQACIRGDFLQKLYGNSSNIIFHRH
jgi:zinc transport system ATP-binding protein